MRNRFLGFWFMTLFGALPVACAVGASDSTTLQAAADAGQNEATSSTGAVNTATVAQAAADANTVGASEANTLLPLGPVTGLARFAFVGRFVTSSPNNIIFGLLASRLGMTFTGTSITMLMADSGIDYFDVVIDGNRLNSPIVVNPNTIAQPYVLAQNLPPAAHTLWLTKRTEAMQNSSTHLGIAHLNGVLLDANAVFLPPPATRPRRLEFVGDSGYSGYGAEAVIGAPNTINCSYSAATQNALKSVPEYTADFLNADHINASVTGKGVYLSYYDPSNTQHTFPILYEMTYPPSGPAYAFEPNSVDAVVLSVGGDDLWGNGGSGYFPNPAFPNNQKPASASNPNGSDPNYFVDAMAQYLVQIDHHYPNTLIVCVLSAAATKSDITTLGDGLQNAIALAKTRGVANAVFFNYFADDATYHTYDDVASKLKLYYGCDGHPSAAGAQWLGARLAGFIATQKGWEAPPSVPYPPL